MTSRPRVPAVLACVVLAGAALVAPVGVVQAGAPSPGTVHAASGAPPTRPGAWRVPVTGSTLLERFDAPASAWGRGHRGVDLVAPAGTVVRAPAAGTVLVARRVVDRGVVTIGHAGGLRSSLEPVDATLEVGAVVAAGDEVGVVDPTGGHCAPRRCLHWGVRDGEVYVDPLDLLGDVTVVLLP